MSLNDANRPAQLGAYAHFPGTGPADKACRDCEHFKVEATKSSTHCACLKWAELQRSMGNKQKRPKSISSGSPACKYFEQAPPKVWSAPGTEKPKFQWGTAKPLGAAKKTTPDDDDKVPF